MFSLTVIHGKRANIWKTMPTPGVRPAISLPRANTLPLVGCMRPARMRKNVDLPQPEGPRKQMISPFRISMLILSRTVTMFPLGIGKR